MTQRLLLLGGLAILAVVCNHAAGWGYTAMFWWTDRYLPVTVPDFDQLRGSTYYALLVVERFSNFSVPAFLFISGFFASYAHSGRGKTWRDISVRITKLLVPYVIWSVAIFVSEALQGVVYTPSEYLAKLALGQATGAYFYVPVICGLYLLSPFVVGLAEVRPRAVLIASLVLQLAAVVIYYLAVFDVESPVIVFASRITSRWMLPRLAFFFVSGIVVKLHSRAFQVWLSQHRYHLLGCLIVLAVLAVFEPDLLYHLSGKDWLHGFTLSTDLYAAAFILSFLSAKSLAVPGSRFVLQLSKNSYTIYLIHPMILEAMARVLRHFLPGVLACQVLFLSLLVGAGVVVPLLLTYGGSKTPIRSYTKWVFG